MKRIQSLGMVFAMFVLAGCVATAVPSPDAQSGSAAPTAADGPRQASSTMQAEQLRVNDSQGPVIVEKVEFRPGRSSATVERLAMRFGCKGSRGAGLLTEQGPVEVYRMQCDNGTVFLAECELRQCRPMRRQH